MFATHNVLRNGRNLIPYRNSKLLLSTTHV